MAEAEVEYESDPEEAKLSLKTRRREASDDEDEGVGGGDRLEKPRRRIEDSEGESEGAAADYEEELEEEEYVDEEEYEEVEVEYEVSRVTGDGDDVQVAAVEKVDGDKEIVGEDTVGEEMGVHNGGRDIDSENKSVSGLEEEGKEMEPFSVPTAGAFYMHDDRFRDNAGGRNRRMLGGRKLWESKDDRKWGHDKFEELTLQERHHEGRSRGSRGRYRGRGRNRGSERVYIQANRPREHSNHSSRSNNNQGSAPDGARGRGPRKHQPSFNNYDRSLVTKKKLSGKAGVENSFVNSGKTSESLSNEETEMMQPRKHVASNLSVASPPFYPTGSSNKESNLPTKRDSQTGAISRDAQHTSGAQSTVMMRGKNIVDSVGIDTCYVDDSPSVNTLKPSSSLQMPISGSSTSNHSQPQLRSQGSGPTTHTKLAYQPVGNQVNRFPLSSQLQSGQRNPGQFRPQTSVQASIQQFTQYMAGGAQVSSPPSTAGTINALESEERESASETNQSRTAVVTEGKGSMPGSGKGSFLFGGAQVMGGSGSMGSGTDQNFPAFLPVMQFGGQHPGGIGVPAVGMAFPGYVAQPQLGIGSSEMTWLPVLAGAAGALGATHFPPYITVDGSYNTRPSGPTSSAAPASSKENNGPKVDNDWKSAQRPELTGEEVRQRQKNPRRYTEMKFDQ